MSAIEDNTMNNNNEWAIIVALAAGVLALLGQIAQSLFSFLGGRKQPIEVSKIQGDIYGTLIDELREQMTTMDGKVERLEESLELEQKRADNLQTDIVILQEKQQWYEVYIERLVSKLQEHKIEPPERPEELD